jgi:serine/threonine-protein kinase RsbW
MGNLDTEFTLPSDPNHVDQVLPFIDEVAQRYRLSPDLQGNMLLTLTEAVTNAMLHGNCGDTSKKVHISLLRHKDALEVRVSDQGKGFNPEHVPDPTSPECLEKCGGRGLFLMRELSDECRFMKNGSIVAMRFNLSGTPCTR